MSKLICLPGWQIVKRIGAGSFGIVYEIERETNGKTEKAAMKVLSVPSDPEEVDTLYDMGVGDTQESLTTYVTEQVQSISQEFRMMEKLKGNPNIVQFEECRIIPHQGWLGSDILIRMELLTPLPRYMRTHPLDVDEVQKLGIHICRALVTCQNQNPPILHRDIKTANIMVDERTGTYKLGDFGVARAMEGTKSAHTKAGTEDYMAPEVLQMKGYFATADIYSLGILLYRLLNNNRSPFIPKEGKLTESVMLEAKRARLSGQPVPPPAHGSARLKQIVLKAIAYDPADRYQTAAELLRELQNCSDETFEEEVEAETVYVRPEVPGQTQKKTVAPPPQPKKTAPPKQKPAAPPKQKAAAPPPPPAAPKKNKSGNGLIAVIAGVIVVALLVGMVFLRGNGKSEKADPGEGTGLSSIVVPEFSEIFTPAEQTEVKSEGDVVVGDVITLGHYRDTDLTWDVLDIEDGMALLFCRQIVDTQPYHQKAEDTNWWDCDLRVYLNTTFLSGAFSDEEQKKITIADWPADANESWPDVEQGDDTGETVSLLSMAEAEKYHVLDLPFENLPGDIELPGAFFWLRTLGEDNQHAVYVDPSLAVKVYSTGMNVDLTSMGVRPAVHLKLGE